MHDPMPTHLEDYAPVPTWAGGHVMTLYTWARPRRFPALPLPQPRGFRVSPDTHVVADCCWQPEPRLAPTIVALHGLEGSSRAHYMRGIADKAFRRGFNVVLVNQRNCGGTEHLTPGLYHSGLTSDPDAVIRELVEVDRLPSIALAGYSLGGNLALKLAGEYADDAPPAVRSVCVVSPTLDLAACTAQLERPRNRIYQWYFLRSLKQRIQRKHGLFPAHYSTEGLAGIRSIRGFDDRYTAPHHGYRDADDYYHRASAARVVDRIRIPTLILTAEDDPFVPVEPVRAATVRDNPNIRVIVTKRGGHCGFASHRADGDDGYWAERLIVRFSASQAWALHRPGSRDSSQTGCAPAT